jgi:parallel beta-helix repeat protein
VPDDYPSIHAVFGKGTSPQLTNNQCNSNKSYGIYFGDGAQGTAQQNVCKKNLDTGIAVLGKGTSPQLTNNQCSSNKIDGIYFADRAGGSAKDNVCEKNLACGIAINAASPVLYRNTLRFNKRHGLAYNSSARPDLKEDQSYEGNEEGKVDAHAKFK